MTIGASLLILMAVVAARPASANAFATHINFQPASAPAYSGYLVDSGATYASRGNGFTYGWAASAATVDRNNSASPDQRYDTYANMGALPSQSAKWELSVPNGSYNVTLVAGDPAMTGAQTILMEGGSFLNGTPTSAQRWITKTGTVSVSDGKLTMTRTSTVAKPNFIDVTSLDQTPPTVTIASPSPGQTVNGTVNATFSANESATFTCMLDGGESTACSSPRSYSGLETGNHTLLVTATDTVLNAGTASVTFTVYPPLPWFIGWSPVSGSGSYGGSNASFSFQVIGASSTLCSIDDGTSSPCVAGADITYSGLSVGSHTFKVVAADAVGNTSTLRIVVIVDLTPPTLTIASPAQGAVVPTSVPITFSDSDSNGIKYRDCSVDEGPASPCTSPFTASTLSPGAHSVKVSVYDIAFNATSKTVSFVSDPAPPPIGSGWSVDWEDDFSQPSMNTSIWNNQRLDGLWADGPYSPYTGLANEGATYEPSNNSFTGNSIVQTLRKPSAPPHGTQYTTGSINSDTHKSVFTGYVEARVKVPACDGCWPALFLIPTAYVQPPEIDIFEFFNTAEPGGKFPMFNVHWKDAEGHPHYLTDPERVIDTADYTENFHTYGVLWTTDYVQLFVDGRAGPKTTDPTIVPNQPMFVVSTLQLGAGHTPAINPILGGDAVAQMETDYIRVLKNSNLP